MYLLVDFGNTRLKWAVSASAWRASAAPARERPIDELLDEVWGALPPPTAVVMVSVAPEASNDALVRWVQARWRRDVHRARSQVEQLGVVNRYREPASLGADRWVALVGARGQFPDEACCVVDCGTAVTVDALTAGGEFAGGVILPGLALARRALTSGTAGIHAGDGAETSCLARSTADAVAAGTRYGLAGAIERVHAELEQALDARMKLVITGGDADRVATCLRPPVELAPDLILKGLERIARTL